MHHASWTADEANLALGASTLIQSSDGYLWIGALGRMFRFDGARFAAVDSITSPALRGTELTLLEAKVVDPSRAMWIGKRDGGLVRYVDGKFTTILGPDSSRDLRGRMISDRAGRLWTISKGKVIVIENDHVIPAPVPREVSLTGVLGIVADTGDGVWFGMHDGSVWHIVANTAKQYQPPASQAGVATRPLLQSSDGTLWVYGKNLQGIRDGRWTDFRLDNGFPISPQAAIETHDHSVVFGTQGQGVIRIHGGILEQYSVADGLSDVHVSAVLEDVEHNLWMLTDAGLDQLYVAPITTIGRGDRVPFESPLSILPDALDGIWILAYEDGRIFHARGGIFDRTSGRANWTSIVFPRAERHTLFASSRSGGIWAGGRDRDGLVRVSENDRVAALPFAAGVIEHPGPMVDDLNGDLWATRYDRGKAQAFGHIRDGKFKASQLTSKVVSIRVQTIDVDAHNHKWLVEQSEHSLLEMVGDSVVWKQSVELPGNPIMHLVRSGEDTLWVVPSVGDLWRVIGHNVRRISLSRGDQQRSPFGNLNVAISGDNFWFASEYEISRFSLATMNALADGKAVTPVRRKFGEADGLRVARTTFVNEMATFTNDGRFWISTPGGLAVYDPRFDLRNDVAPRAIVEEMTVGGKPINRSARIKLEPQPDRVEIHYTATSLRMPSRIRLEYRLDGADEKWVTDAKARVATYTQLRPGKYTFHVRAWNEDGVPNSNEASLDFEVLPTWYQTMWLRIVALVVFVGLGPVLVFQRQRAQNRERELRLHARFDAALAERTRVAGELHDTLLQGFTGITLQLGGVQRSIAAADQKASERLANVLTTADSTLRDARQAIWDMRSPELASRSLSEAVEHAARGIVADTSVQLSFAVHGETRRVSPTIESAIFRISREAVANAAKHSGCHEIHIVLNYAANELSLAVTDDGCGMTHDEELSASASGHFGIRGMRERAARLEGSFELTSSPRNGTSITIVVPTPFL